MRCNSKQPMQRPPSCAIPCGALCSYHVHTEKKRKAVPAVVGQLLVSLAMVPVLLQRAFAAGDRCAHACTMQAARACMHTAQGERAWVAAARHAARAPCRCAAAPHAMRPERPP